MNRCPFSRVVWIQRVCLALVFGVLMLFLSLSLSHTHTHTHIQFFFFQDVIGERIVNSLALTLSPEQKVLGLVEDVLCVLPQQTKHWCGLHFWWLDIRASNPEFCAPQHLATLCSLPGTLCLHTQSRKVRLSWRCQKLSQKWETRTTFTWYRPMLAGATSIANMTNIVLWRKQHDMLVSHVTSNTQHVVRVWSWYVWRGYDNMDKERMKERNQCLLLLCGCEPHLIGFTYYLPKSAEGFTNALEASAINCI